MLSSKNKETKNNYKKPKTLYMVSSSSPSSFSSQSSSFSQPSISLQSNPIRTMEQVWKDINLTPMKTQKNYPNPSKTTTCINTFSNMILQDFLNRPFENDPLLPNNLFSDSHISSNPITNLRLNSGHQQFQFLVHNNNSDHAISSDSDHLQMNPIVSTSSSSSPTGLTNFRKKTYTESDNNSFGQDRLHKRMIKNRESAARSRARKQAYINELELEVEHLMEENARLRRQQKQFCQSSDAQLPKSKKYTTTLYRTSTAPF